MATREERFARELDKIAVGLEPEFRAAFLSSVDAIKSKIPLREATRLLAAGNVDAAIALLSVELADAGLNDIKNVLQTAFIGGGTAAANFASKFSQLDVRFNIVNPATARILETFTTDLVTRVSEDMRSTITSAVRQGVILGEGPASVARKFRDSIGLSRRLELATENFEAALRNKPMQALSRKLRDKRFDGTIRSAVTADKALTEGQINKMVASYRRRAILHRSQVIARTESLRAVNLGNQALWIQAVDEGKIPEQNIRRFWIPTLDERLREAHRAIPQINSDGVGLNEPFQSPLGPIMFPTDPSAEAANSINCRCTVMFRVVENGI